MTAIHSVSRRLLRWALAVASAAACLMASDARGVLRHQWTFNDGTANDPWGGAHGILNGSARILGGQLILDGSGTVDLPASGPNGININTYEAITISIFATPSSAMTGFHTLLGFGDVSSTNPNLAANYFYLSTHRGDNVSRAAISISDDADPFTEEDSANGPEFNDNLKHHYAAVLTDSSISLYCDCTLRQTSPLPVNGADNMISGIGTEFARIGSSYPNDPNFIGAIESIRIYDTARTPQQIVSECVMDVDPLPRRLTINRVTGAMILSNHQPAFRIVGYSITSAAGALNPAAWQSIADNFDADSGTSIVFDDDDNWTKLSAAGSKTDFSEFEFDGGDGGVLGMGGITEIPLGASGAWRRSIYEDLQIAIRLEDGSSFPVQVVYSGNNFQRYRRSDLDFNGTIDVADWEVFLASSGFSFPEMSVAESYAFGDLNGDLINDRRDFQLFKSDYVAALGEAAFADLLAAGVPEPSTLVILLGMWPAALLSRNHFLRRH